MRNLLFIALVGLLSCSPATQGPDAAQDATMSEVRLLAKPSGTARVLLTLENDSSEQIGYNLCSSSLERREGDEWVPVPPEEMCTQELRLLDPSRSVAYEKNFPGRLPSGEYRYVTSVEAPVGTAQRRLASAPFTVI